jgi:hypothetical protein
MSSLHQKIRSEQVLLGSERGSGEMEGAGFRDEK